MWIKICGNTNLEDARLAVDGGADALGFVFAPGPRRVTAAQARHITAELPPRVETYGVFVNATFDEIVETVTVSGVAGVQLHGSLEAEWPEAELPSRLREHFASLSRRLAILAVLRWGAAFDRAIEEYSRNPAVDAVLVDSWTAQAPGGTGKRFDWSAAQAGFLRANPKVRMIVAGGLRPENVGEAISLLRPWGVDVASGVEAVPGKKDPALLLAFLEAVRRAAGEEQETRMPVQPVEERP